MHIPGEEARPSPRLAATLSLVFPGLGQAYCGAFLSAPVFAGVAVFLVLSMLQAWQEWRRSAIFLAVAALVLALYAANAALSSRLAERRARRMERHAALWRWLAPWVRSGDAARSAPEIVLFLVFLAVAIGIVADWRWARPVSRVLAYWPVFELIGGFSVGYYAGFIEHAEAHLAGERRYSTRGVVTGLIVFQCAAAAAMHFAFKVPVFTLLFAFALTLPGQVHAFAAVGAGRERAKLKAGSILISLVVSFFLAFMIASILERPGVAKVDLGAFASMLMGAIYMACRVPLDAMIRHLQREAAPG